MDNLSNKEQADLVKAFWRDYGRWILVAIIIGLLAGFGWRWYQGHEQQKKIAASALYNDMLQTSLVGANEKPVNAAIMNDFKNHFPNSTYRVFAEFYMAHQQMKKGKFSAAEKNLRAVVASGANTALKDLARVRLARVLLEQKQPKAALQAVAKVNKKSSDLMGVLVDMVRYKAYVALNNKPKAAELLNALQAQAKSKGIDLPAYVTG